MRICLFTPVFLPAIGGAELAVDALARRFKEAGHETFVLARGNKEKLDLPYEVRWAPRPSLPHWFPERIGRHLRELHDREHFDIFLSNYTHPTGHAAVQIGKQAGVPVIIGSQGGDLYHSSKHRKQRHLWKRTEIALAEASGLVAISPHMESLIREIVPDPPPIARIPNGVDTATITRIAERPKDFEPDRPFMLCLGNIGPMKGFDDAIDAFDRSRGQLGDLILVVTGDGPMEKMLHQQVERLNLQEHVIFTGKRTGNDKRWLLQHCRFGVMPSIEEGLPLVALEFMANGRALLCSTNPSFDDLCDNGESGLRVRPRSPDDLAEAMVAMAAADLDAMGTASQLKATRFDWSNVAKEYLSFIEQVVSGKV